MLEVVLGHRLKRRCTPVTHLGGECDRELHLSSVQIGNRDTESTSEGRCDVVAGEYTQTFYVRGTWDWPQVNRKLSVVADAGVPGTRRIQVHGCPRDTSSSGSLGWTRALSQEEEPKEERRSRLCALVRVQVNFPLWVLFCHRTHRRLSFIIFKMGTMTPTLENCVSSSPSFLRAKLC